MLGSLLALAMCASLGAPDDQDEPPYPEEQVFRDESSAGRVRLAAVGGTLFDLQGGAMVPFGGGHLAYAFDRFDLGVVAQAYRFGLVRARSEWEPVVLARLDQRFETRRGLEAVLGLGIGAARENGWTAWFQFTVGARLVQGPFFFGGEFGFEQDRFFRLGATAGVALF